MLDIAETTTFEWGRISTGTDWLAPLAVLTLLLAYVFWMYRRDAAELGIMRGGLLALLRGSVFCLLVGIYLQPQWRHEQTLARNAKIHLLVDTSLSMSMTDADGAASYAAESDTAASDTAESEPTRSQRVARALASEDWLARLRDRHDVVVSTFDKDIRGIASLTRREFSPSTEPTTNEDTSADAVAENNDAGAASNDERSGGDTPGNAAPIASAGGEIDWELELTARGDQSRLGDAVAKLVETAGSSPVAGIIVITDGAENAGLAAEVAAQRAGETDIPIFPIGVGSVATASQARIAELEAPHRAYPGDRFVVTGFVQAFGMAGESVEASLYIQPAGDGDSVSNQSAPAPGVPNQSPPELIETQTVTLGADAELLPVRFEVAPSAVGRHMLLMRLSPRGGDTSGADPAADDTPTQHAAIDIVQRRSRVLLVAGGPTREYQFVRGVLWRDAEVAVDIHLQTAQSGISQDADAILARFPDTAETLLPYDAIIAFDPDWRKLSSQQRELLANWVGKQAGGLVMIAGDVYTDRCAQDSSLDTIRELAPVEFFERFSIAESLRPARAVAWSIELSEIGRDTEMLWIDDTRTTSLAAWQGFEGVYASHRVRGVKPGAVVYARHAGAESGFDSRATPYLVEHFYGSGRVFYIGSGELWRWRRVGEGHFERFYTKLIRHVSQGRLHRGASGGVLLTERDRYSVGQTVVVRAQLRDERGEPYRATEATLTIMTPGGAVETANLLDDGEGDGNFSGQFTPSREGSYRLIAFASDESRRVARSIQVRLPDLERQYSTRNDALLQRVAQRSGGKYFIGPEQAFGMGEDAPLWQRIEDRTQYVVQQLAPTQLWDNAWMMLALCGLLSTEWTARRLARLA